MYTEVAKNIYRIPVRLPDSPLKVLNSYFVKDPVRSLLIDTGFYTAVCKEALMTGLDMLEVKPDEFDIFLTHMHSDHAGLAADIIADGKQILLSERDLRLLDTTDDGERIIWADLARRFKEADMPEYIIDNINKINPAIAFSSPTESTQYVGVPDGTMIRAGGYTFRCTLTAGHTPGHMCLWDEDSGIIFTGDHVLFDITPNITSWAFVSDSLGNYLDSLRAVSKLNVKLALPGHRNTGDFYSRIDELLHHHDVRLAEVERIIRECPGLTVYEIAGRMKWKIRTDSWAEFPAAQKIFAVGECMSHIDYQILRGKIKNHKDGAVYRYYSA